MTALHDPCLVEYVDFFLKVLWASGGHTPKEGHRAEMLCRALEYDSIKPLKKCPLK